MSINDQKTPAPGSASPTLEDTKTQRHQWYQKMTEEMFSVWHHPSKETLTKWSGDNPTRSKENTVMKLRWKKEVDGELTLQYFNPLDWRDNGEHWENVPTFEPCELKTIKQAIAAERERCAKIVNGLVNGPLGSEVIKAIRKQVATFQVGYSND